MTYFIYSKQVLPVATGSFVPLQEFEDALQGWLFPVMGILHNEKFWKREIDHKKQALPIVSSNLYFKSIANSFGVLKPFKVQSFKKDCFKRHSINLSNFQKQNWRKNAYLTLLLVSDHQRLQSWLVLPQLVLQTLLDVRQRFNLSTGRVLAGFALHQLELHFLCEEKNGGVHFREKSTSVQFREVF